MPTLLVGDGAAVLVGQDSSLIGCCGVSGEPTLLVGRDPATLLVGSEPTLIGCGPVGCVVGAETQAEAAGVWVKTRFYQDGPFLCATVYSVTAGEPKIVELRVDTRPIARALIRAHSALHAKDTALASLRGSNGATVGWSLGKMWKGVKKAAKKIGRNKLVKGVVGVTKTIGKAATKVVKSKVTGLVAAGLAAFPLTAPIGVAALGAYAAANAALNGVEAGRKVVKTAQTAGRIINQGVRAAKAVAGTNQRTAAAVKTAGALMPAKTKALVAARVKAAGTLKLNAKGKAAVASTLARAPAAARAKVATALASKLKGLATLKSRAALAKSLPPTAAAAVVNATRLQVAASPVIAQAKALQAKLAQPTVRNQLALIRAQGVKSQAALQQVADAAKGGSLDAQKSAAIINLVARNRARIQGMSQTNAGGLPGMLITRDGKLRRGRWRVEAVATQGGTLYTGPNKTTERGTFKAVVSGGPVLIGRVGSTDIIAGPTNPVVLVGRCMAAIGTTLFGEPVEVESGEGVRLSSIAVNGELPEDGVRMFGKGPNAGELGVYEVSGALIGCGSAPCAPCAAASPV